jgi:hypothetical protein
LLPDRWQTDRVPNAICGVCRRAKDGFAPRSWG